MKKHENSDQIQYDNVLGCPKSAIYYFRPYLATVETYAYLVNILKEDEEDLKES